MSNKVNKVDTVTNSKFVNLVIKFAAEKDATAKESALKNAPYFLANFKARITALEAKIQLK
jgi:hypothetical protein